MSTMSITQIRNIFIEYIRAEYPDIFCKMDFINNPELYKYGIIHGDMLSGKTDAILVLSLYSALTDIVPIISVPKSGDIYQIKKSVCDFNARWISYLHKKNGKVKPEIECKLQFLDAFELEVDVRNNIKNASEFLRNFRKNAVKIPSVIFTLHHSIQLGRLHQVVKQISEARCAGPIRSYSMFFDECHRTLEPDTVGVYEKPLPKVGSSNFPALNIGDSVKRLIDNSTQIIGISATPFKSVFSDLYPITYIIALRPKNGSIHMGEYRSVSHLEYFHIRDIKDMEPHEDPDLHKVIAELSTTPPLTSEINIRLPEKQLPYITLFQLSRLKEDHEKVYDYMTKNYDDKFNIVVFNSGAVKIKFTKNVVDSIKGFINYFNGKKLMKTDVSAEGVAYLDLGTPIHNVLDIFTIIGVEKFERINIIAGDKLREGIRVNSSDYKLSLSAEYIRDESNMDNALQKLRIVGYRRHTGTLKVWCTKRFHSDAIKSFYITHEIVDKLNQKYHYGDVETSVDILKNTKISATKLPKNKLSKEKMPMVKVKTDKDDFSISAIEYTKLIKQSCMKELLSRNTYEVDTAESDDKCYLIPTTYQRYKEVSEMVQTLHIFDWGKMTDIGDVLYKSIWNFIKNKNLKLGNRRKGLLVSKREDGWSIKFDP